MSKSRWFRIVAIGVVGMITPVLFAARPVAPKKQSASSTPAKLTAVKPVASAKAAKPAVTAKHVAPAKATRQTAKSAPAQHHVVAHSAKQTASKARLTTKTPLAHKTLAKTPSKQLANKQ